MSKPILEAELAEQKLQVLCWECNEEFFEGNTKEIEEWAEKSENGACLNFDDRDEGFASCHCYDCSYIYHL